MVSRSHPSLDATAHAQRLAQVRALIHSTEAFFAQHQDAQAKMLRAHLYDLVDARPNTPAAQHLRSAAMLLDQQAARFQPALLQAIRAGIEEELDTVFPGALAALRPLAPEPESESPISMALLDVDEIERHLLVDRVAQRFNQRYEAVLQPLTRALAVLFGMSEFSFSDNPFRPATFVRAYAIAWKQCEFDPEAAEDFVLALAPEHGVDWEPLYNGLAQILLRAGISGQEVHRIKRAAGAAGSPSASAPLGSASDASGHGPLQAGGAAEATAGGGGSGGGGGGGGGLAQAGLQIAERARQFLQRLGFAGGRAAGPGGVGGGSGVGAGHGGQGSGASPGGFEPSAVQAEADATLMGFLGGLQQRVGAGSASSQFPSWLDSQDFAGANVLRRMHERDEVRNAPEIDRGTIDALAEVFDFVFADRAIPMQLKLVIGRLQIPVLKAAMIDRDFFLSTAHPARQLVDALAAASVAWIPERGESDPLYQRIEATVRRVLAEFDNDLALFGMLLADFQAWLQENRRQAELRIEPVVQQAQGAEDLAQAQAHVDEVLHHCVRALPAGEPLQPFLLPFLATQWREVLVQAWRARASEPQRWETAVRTLDELVWSTRPLPQAGDRARLVALLPDLVARLNAGMDTLGWAGEDRAAFTRRLIDTHMKAIRPPRPAGAAMSAGAGAASTATAIPTATATATAGSPAVATIAAAADVVAVDPERSAGQDALQALDARRARQQPAGVADAFDEAAQALVRGQWFDLLDAPGQARRYRLGWVSPQRTRMLFTNREGFEAIVHSQREVAALLREGRLQLLDDQPIVGRAIDQLMAPQAGGTAALDVELL